MEGNLFGWSENFNEHFHEKFNERVRWWRVRSMRAGWHTRALGARAKHALGTREARAFAGFNEHPTL